jgi:hypothetical protein
MAKSRTLLSDSELSAYSKEHVLHEISMMVNCAQHLKSAFRGSPATVQVLRNTVIESFAIHVRNLVDFLYPTRIRGDDVVADDFFEQGTRPAGFPAISKRFEDARTRAHKQLSHLTTGRISGNAPGKEWDPELATEILAVLAQFVSTASQKKLDATVRDFVLAVRRPSNC